MTQDAPSGLTWGPQGYRLVIDEDEPVLLHPCRYRWRLYRNGSSYPVKDWYSMSRWGARRAARAEINKLERQAVAKAEGRGQWEYGL